MTLVQIYAALAVSSIDLIIAGIVLAQNYRSRTNVAYASMAASAAIWGLGVGFFLLTKSSQLQNILGRELYFAGSLIPTFFLYFALLFSEKEPPTRLITALVFLPMLAFFILYFFTDLVLTGVTISSEGVRSVMQGPWYHVFDVHIWGFFITAFYILVKKYRNVSHNTQQQIIAILVGTYGALSVAGISNIILLSFFQNFRYLWVGPIATIVFIASTGFAVARFQFFNIRAIVSEILVVALWFVLLARVFVSENQYDLILNGSFFLAVLGLGIYLIGIIVRQNDQRQRIEEQEHDLALMNEKQEALLHFISHEIKGYFAKSEAAFAGIQEGDYGPAPSDLKRMAANALEDTRSGASMAINILDASNLKQGAISYSKQYFDFGKSVLGVLTAQRKSAERNGLAIDFNIPTDGSCMMYGDELKITRHVITNLIDNAIRYTRAGSIDVAVTCTPETVRMSVKDTGVGISPEDQPILFTEGGHGKNALETNVHATGYGLFIAKLVVDAHKGTIKALSEGPDKGSEFVVELPVGKVPDTHSSFTPVAA